MPPSAASTHMCGFWKEGGVGLSGSLEVGFTGGLAKFSFRALRLPGRTKRGADPESHNMHGTLSVLPAGTNTVIHVLVLPQQLLSLALEISLYMCD